MSKTHVMVYSGGKWIYDGSYMRVTSVDQIYWIKSGFFYKGENSYWYKYYEQKE